MPADQDTVKIDALIELLIQKGLVSRDEVTDALYKKLNIPVQGAKAQPKK